MQSEHRPPQSTAAVPPESRSAIYRVARSMRLSRNDDGSSIRSPLQLVAIFIAVHAGYYALGVRYDSSALSCLWQFLDIELLRDRLSESLWYLHSQPPLFNALLGVSLKFFEGNLHQVWWVAALVTGLLAALGLYRFMRGLGVRERLALALSGLFIASPPFVLYEHFLFYTHFELVLFLLGGWLLTRINKNPSLLHFSGFFFTLAALCYLRSFYHLVFLLAFTLWLLIDMRRYWRRVLGCAVLPILLVFSLYVKNYRVFGTFSASSWIGMNLANNLRWFVPEERLSKIVRNGAIDPIIMVTPFSPLKEIELRAKRPPQFDAIPALSYLSKTELAVNANEKLYCSVNFNHAAYIDRSQRLFAAARELFREYPKAFLLRTVVAWNYYFYPSSRYRRLLPNSSKIQPVVEFYELVMGRFMLDTVDIDDQPSAVYLVPLLGFPLLFVLGLLYLPRHCTREEQILLLYALGCIAYVSFLGNFLEVPENNRFRYPIDPFFLCLLGKALTVWSGKQAMVAKE